MSFINPIFLFAASAALLPIIYHLIRKTRAKKVRFSSLLFLKATPKQIIKRRRLRDLLLLIMRCAILGILALVFARPYVPREAVPFIALEKETSSVILIDNSFSMQLGDLFSRAVDAALDQVGKAGPGDEIAVVVFSDDAEQISQLSSDMANHRTMIRNAAQVSNRATDFYRPLRLAEQILQDARHPDRSIVLISDFQNNGWSSQFDNWHIDAAIEFVPIRIAAESPRNSFIDKSDLTLKRSGNTSLARFGIQVNAMQADAENPGEEISLWNNGVKVETGGRLSAAYPYRSTFQQAGLRFGAYQGRFVLSEDDLDIDNTHYFSFEVVERPGILCIDGSRRSSRSNAFYLEKCFDMGDQSRFAFEAGGGASLTAPRLLRYALVFLTNQRSLSTAQTGQLRQYVERGGNLILSFGSRVNVAQFSTALGDLGIGRIAENVWVRSMQSNNAIIGEADLKHPVFAAFAKSGSGDIFKPKFSRYLRIEPDSGATVVSRFDTGDPFLLERSLGTGKIMVLTTSFNTEWGDFPVNEIFLPFVYQLAQYAVTPAREQTAYLVGETVQLDGRSGAEWEIRSPGDKIHKATGDADGIAYFRETDVPGNYQAASGNRTVYFSVNIDPAESDLSSRDAEEAQAAVVGTPQQDDESPRAAAVDQISEDEKRQSLWKYLLVFIILLFLLETLIANRKVAPLEGSK